MTRDDVDPPPTDVPADWRPLEAPPASARDDELMRDPPPGEHHRGRFAGYDAGRRVRRILLACLAVLVVGTMFAWYQWARRGPPPAVAQQFQLPAGTDTSDRPRVLTWSQGQARLGLSREPPGVHTIELPDRTLKLADGADTAQFRVVVADGKTTAIELESGRVVEVLHPGATPLLAP